MLIWLFAWNSFSIGACDINLNEYIVNIENIIRYFGECLLFMNDDKKILVHCFAGSSRSATIIIAYLMWKNQLDYVESSNILQKIRPIVYPNYGFVRQLQMFEKLLKKNKYNISNINFEKIKYPRIIEECCF